MGHHIEELPKHPNVPGQVVMLFIDLQQVVGLISNIARAYIIPSSNIELINLFCLFQDGDRLYNVSKFRVVRYKTIPMKLPP